MSSRGSFSSLVKGQLAWKDVLPSANRTKRWARSTDAKPVLAIAPPSRCRSHVITAEEYVESNLDAIKVAIKPLIVTETYVHRNQDVVLDKIAARAPELKSKLNLTTAQLRAALERLEFFWSGKYYIRVVKTPRKGKKS